MKFNVVRLSNFLLNSREQSLFLSDGFVFRQGMIILDRDRQYGPDELGEIVSKYCKQFSVSNKDHIDQIVKTVANAFREEAQVEIIKEPTTKEDGKAPVVHLPD